ncbi:hypothetical protein HK105_203811 [Polyrhizophydium stewartii]|uniref:Extracellular metalloproteinase n=1 Tax=Polyrhizophydium stewartii TaxID=2732419 RepID=A0ABR4NB81_9FUNG|nr:Fungalysin/Thermolysin Extracellular metalloproteinase 5 [Polyrhizophydium stewartii]
MRLSLACALVPLVAAAPRPALVARDEASLPGFYSPDIRVDWSPPSSLSPRNLSLDGPALSDAAWAHLAANLALGAGVSMSPKQSYQDDDTGIYYFHVNQLVDGIEIANSVATAVLDQHGNPVASHSAWVDMAKVARPSLSRRGAKISAADAFVALAASLGSTIDAKHLTVSAPDADGKLHITGVNTEVTAETKLYKTATALREVWDISLPLSTSWLNAFVDKETGKVLGTADWSSLAQPTEHGTRVVKRDNELKAAGANINCTTTTRTTETKPRKKATGGTDTVSASKSTTAASTKIATKSDTKASTTSKAAAETTTTAKTAATTTTGAASTSIPPTVYRVVPLGNRDPRFGGFKLVKDPFDKQASPLGWHDAGNGAVSITKGNNVFAFDNSGRNPATGTKGKNFVFDFAVDDARQQPPQYVDASVTNAFFLANAYHDILFKYGFDEKAGNFQTKNKAGGKGNDAVLANIQDRSGTNNANFATPPDGKPGRMRMFLFNRVNPQRDGALDNDVVLHELTHGLSNRLTGGPANANCLQTLESGGMGEGWSDMVAMTLEFTAKDKRTTDKPLGVYVTNKAKGIRKFPYSTNIKTNTHTLSDIPKNREVHAVGEVWASMLFEVYWNLVDKLGFEPNIKDGAKSGKGNTEFLQLVVNGMKLQPCNPTFVDARDAIIKADQIRNKGANKCEIFKGFAKRGLGNGARKGVFTNSFTLPAGC